MSRSADGGATFGPPVWVQKSTGCTVSDDKNWLVADNQPNSRFNGRVFVTFGARNLAAAGGNLIQQQLAWSSNGATFSAPIALGPHSNLKYAAVSGGKFPGDYTGLSATASRITAVWCISSKPPNPVAAYHQTL